MRSLLSSVLIFVCAPIVSASTITVNGLGDSLVTDGVCTLREAVINANNNAATWPDCAPGSGADVINLPAGTITLSTGPRGDELSLSGDIDVLDSVTINGNAAGTIVDAAGIDRVFDFNPKANAFDPPRPAITVNINNLTIQGGDVHGDGGGFRVDENATVNANGVTVTGNSGNNDGGGVKVETGGILNMTNSTISGNSVSLLYAGLRSDGTTTLTSCTVTNNSNSSLTSATRGNGLGGSGISLRNTIVAGNDSGPDTEGGFTSLGYNIIGNRGVGTTITATTGDQFSVTAAQVKLGPLQNNGGPTQTHALQTGSIAIDKGDSSGLTTDQRGDPRPCDDVTISNAPGGDGADIGAFEVQGCVTNTPPVANSDTYAVNQDTTLTVAAPGVLGNDTDTDGDVLHAVLVTNAAHGSVVLNSDGSFTYTPNPSFACSDTFTYKANDGFFDSNVVTVTINVVDTQAPSISASVAVPVLWPPDHNLVNVGFAFNATDNGCGALTTQLGVFSDEPDVNNDADSNFSPDATNIGTGTLRLRAERANSNGDDGRVYLIRVAATDSSGNKSSRCVAVVVPMSNSAKSVSDVKARGLAAANQCTATGIPPAGYVVVGTGPVIGPKQ